MAFFGLKLGLDLEMRAAHPHLKIQKFKNPRGHIHSGFISFVSNAGLCHNETEHFKITLLAP